MFSHLSSLARSSVIALAALASVATAAPAAPLGPTVMPAVADGGAMKPTLVQGEGRDKWNPAYQWPRGRRGGDFRAGRGRDFYDGGRRYDRRDYVRDRRHYRRHYRDNYYRPRSGFYLGLGLAPAYRYADPYYYDDPYYSVPVYRPRVQRRVYRSGGGSHVEWCYNRYRSYRAWDNTFQPYNGPRQLCYSPYS